MNIMLTLFKQTIGYPSQRRCGQFNAVDGKMVHVQKGLRATPESRLGRHIIGDLISEFSGNASDE